MMSPIRPADTIGGALSLAAAKLRTGSSTSPRLDAEVILGHLLGKSRTRLAIDTDSRLSPETFETFDCLVERRIAGEPVAYLIGRREFMGHEFAVGPGVLVPRPETEMLVELALSTIERLWPAGPVRALDLCTGSGAIALSLAIASDPRIIITGSDISSDALDFAHKNRERFGLESRVALIEGDLLTWTEGPWDLIVTNPPYLRPDQIDGNSEIESEPRLALDGGDRGLEIIERILDQAVERVASRFALLIELDPDHARDVDTMARTKFPDATVRIVPDLTGRDRFIAVERNPDRPAPNHTD